jgi:hypothetical protein
MLNHLGNGKTTEFPDWFVTVIFYTAVHCIEAIIYQQFTLHADSHGKRDEILRRRLSTADQLFLTAYRSLEVQSRQARYMFDKKYQMTNNDCEDALKNLEVIETDCKRLYFTNYPNI